MAVLRVSYAVMLFRALLWTGGESCSNGVYPESGFALVHHVFKSFHVDHLVFCYISCASQPSCQSLNYNPDDKTCQLNNDTKYFRPKYFVEKPLFVYAENPSSEHPWRKLNSAPVCFGAKDDRFGRFQVEFSGSIEAVKLVHLSGQVTCSKQASHWSKWGCDGNSKEIFVYLTNASNTILLPMGQSSRYSIPGYGPQSSEIVFSGFPNPLPLSSGQELRMWYMEDLKNLSEHDNDGTSCADVFVKYLSTQRASFFCFQTMSPGIESLLPISPH